MSSPYIGITGFMDCYEVEVIMRSLQSDMLRKLMVGVLVSDKTLGGGTNKYPRRYPKVEGIGKIFVKHPQVINIIHFHSNKSQDLYNQLLRLMHMAGEDLCDGFQLNMAWPDYKELEKFKEHFPEKKIIIQVNRNMLESGPCYLETRFLLDYENLVDYILFDGSGGYGINLDVDSLLPYIKGFSRLLRSVNIVVAGGLEAANLRVLEPLLKICPNLSIDAEGKLRDERDNLSIIKARNYLHEAMDVLK